MLAVILEDFLYGVAGKIKCLIHFNMEKNPAEWRQIAIQEFARELNKHALLLWTEKDEHRKVRNVEIIMLLWWFQGPTFKDPPDLRNSPNRSLFS